MLKRTLGKIFSKISAAISIGLFSSLAFAADAEPAGAMSGGLGQGLMLAAFLLIFYYFIIRPQNKRAKEHQRLITDIQKGDEVITSGGLIGKITKVGETFFMVMIAENTEVMVQKNAIAATLPKGTMKAA